MLRTLLLTITLSAALPCLTTSAASAGTNPSPIAATPAARIAHAPVASARHKHARTSCSRSRKHRRKHSQHCRTLSGLRKGRTYRSRTRPGHAAHRRTSFSLAHPFRARGAGHSSEATTTVTVDPASAATTIATPCQGTDAIPTAANIEQVKAAILCLVNQERVRNNELPLQIDARLAHAAQSHSNDMIERDYFAHVAPDGETPFDRVKASGYIPNSQVGYTVGENLAWGTLYLATPSSIEAAWVASPEHLANILDADYRDTAIGVVPAAPPSLADGQAGAIYTQEFGVISG
jgi:uncharacterized protein YkwD